MESVGAIELINITNDNIDASLIMVDNSGEQVPVVKVVPKKSGETMLTVVDEENNPWIVKVIVGDVGGGGEPTNPTIAEIKNFKIENVSFDDIEFGMGVFEVTGDYDNVGFQYYDTNDQIQRLELERKEDNKYSFIIPKNTNLVALDDILKIFAPFVVQKDKTLTVHTLEGKFFTFVDTNTTVGTPTSIANIKINSQEIFSKYNSILRKSYSNDPTKQGKFEGLLDLLEAYKNNIILNGSIGVADFSEALTSIKSQMNSSSFDTRIVSSGNTTLRKKYQRISANRHLDISDNSWPLIQSYMNLVSAAELSSFTEKQGFIGIAYDRLGGIMKQYGFINGSADAITDTEQFITDIKDELPGAIAETASSLKNTYLSFVYHTSCNTFNIQSNCEIKKQYEDDARENILAVINEAKFISKISISIISSGLHDITGNADYKALSDSMGAEAKEQLGDLSVKTIAAYENLNLAKDNLDKLEDKEYWEGVLTGYTATITTELTAAIGTTKYVKDKSSIIAKNMGLIIVAFSKKIEKFKYAGTLSAGTKFDDIYNGTDEGWKDYEKKYNNPCYIISIQNGSCIKSFSGVKSYLVTEGKLPSNYITKQEALNLGWTPSQGNLWDVAPGKSIGGVEYQNREGLLPVNDGRVWKEADIEYTGGYRNNKRIFYSNDGLFYKTEDHNNTSPIEF